MNSRTKIQSICNIMSSVNCTGFILRTKGVLKMYKSQKRRKSFTVVANETMSLTKHSVVETKGKKIE